uniref:Spermatogenesis associated 20 n=1 Tax=Eptatretus burgeri TaxID=7764 RepID=A0A8C4R7I0_EPTBU
MADLERPAEMWWGQIAERAGEAGDQRGDGRRQKDHRPACGERAACGRGGCPMSVCRTPEFKPFVDGPYFPPEDRSSHPGFKILLQKISKEVKTDAQNIGSRDLGSPGPLHTISCEHYGELFWSVFFHSPSLCLTPANLAFLLGSWALEYDSVDGVRALEIALPTLRMVAHGGMRDHVGQGFHRYSTDGLWQGARFEKMLYDRAQLAVASAHAFQESQMFTRAKVGRCSRNRGFYSAEDADSHPSPDAKDKKEGAFYVWTEAKIRQLLGEPLAESTEGATLADVFIHHYWVKENGNVDSAYPLAFVVLCQMYFCVRSLTLHLELEWRIVGCETLFCINRLDQVKFRQYSLSTWSAGLAMSADARVGAILSEERILEQATGIAHFRQTHLHNSTMKDLLQSTYLGSQGTIEHDEPELGMPLDRAFVIRGLLDLYEARQETNCLHWPACLQQRQNELFWDSKGSAYFTTSASRPGCLFRMKEDQDGAEPMGNSVSASNLLRLAIVTGHSEWGEHAVHLLQAFGELLVKVPMVVPEMVCCPPHLPQPELILFPGHFSGSSLSPRQLPTVVRFIGKSSTHLACGVVEGGGGG